MPVLSRIDWLVRQLRMGRAGHVQIGPAADPGKLKVRVVLHAPIEGALAETARVAIEAVLGQVRQLAAVCVATDRGHRHSSGLSEVAIWLQPVAKAKEESLGQCTGTLVDRHSTPTSPSPSVPPGTWQEEVTKQPRATASQQPAAPQKPLASTLASGLEGEQSRASSAAVQVLRETSSSTPLAVAATSTPQATLSPLVRAEALKP